MTNNLVLLVAFIKSFLFVNRAHGYVGSYLGEQCKYDRDCNQIDPNSHCSLYSQRLLCICKNNYYIGIINNTEKCIYGKFPEEEKEGLTAAPIILCFLICVLFEAFGLLAFRYWKKHRRSSVTRHGALHMQTVTLSEFARFSRHRNDPVTFILTPEMESVISGTRLSSPPPYSQTVIVETNVNSQREDSPPPYDEALKQGIHSCKVTADENNHRKMSC